MHASADFGKAERIVVNAKTQRVGVCNAAESLLVDAEVAEGFLVEMLPILKEHGVFVHGDELTCSTAQGLGFAEGSDFVSATEEDWGREYLALEMSVKVVSGLDEAIAHINRYGTHHSEAIVAEGSRCMRALPC